MITRMNILQSSLRTKSLSPVNSLSEEPVNGPFGSCNTEISVSAADLHSMSSFGVPVIVRMTSYRWCSESEIRTLICVVDSECGDGMIIESLELSALASPTVQNFEDVHRYYGSFERGNIDITGRVRRFFLLRFGIPPCYGAGDYQSK